MTVLCAAAAITVLAGCAHAEAPAGYHLVWSDEFNAGTLPDPAKWRYDTWRNKDGWWNKEAQYYSDARPENARIENGHLVIEVRREDLSKQPDFGGQKYSSARRPGVFAIEKDLVASWPGTWKSMYWPGKYAISSGSTSLTTRWRMSWVTGSFATTSTVPFLSGSPEAIISSS